MIEQDTIKLLRECDAGIQMGVSAIDEVMDYVTNDSLKKQLEDCKNSHESLRKELEVLLDRYHDDGKSPNPMAKSMSWMKTKVDLFADPSDETVADLMTDGCNMGVKSLNRYLNEFKDADEAAKDVARRLIRVEEQLAKDLRPYL